MVKCEMAQNLFCWLSVLAGLCTILGGCFYSIAYRNPGGPPVPASEAKWAVQIAYVTFGIGVVLAVFVPMAIILLRWSTGDRKPHDQGD